MANNKDIGGIGLAFGGFVFLVLAVKGTFGKVWHDLFQGSGDSNSASDPLAPGAQTYDGTGRPSSTGGYYKVTSGGKTWLVPIDPNKGTRQLLPEASYFPGQNPPGTPGGGIITTGGGTNV